MSIKAVKKAIKQKVPKALVLLYGLLRHPREPVSLIEFLGRPIKGLSFLQRLVMVKRLYVISHALDCHHSQHEMIAFIRTVLSLPPYLEGCVVEAGAYRGGSTAKFSIAAGKAGRRLVAFDSFELRTGDGRASDEDSAPALQRDHDLQDISGQVNKDISTFGEPEVCELVKGRFEDTMPGFSRPIAALFIDAGSAASTRTCLRYLYPLLATGGVMYCHDGHMKEIVNMLDDDVFWETEVGSPKPRIDGLGEQKLLRCVKHGP